MAVLADWHGRVVRPNLNLRGDIPRAVALLSTLYKGFDRKKAAEPPYAVPDWAKGLVEEDGAAAMASFLKKAHGERARRTLEDLAGVYRSFDLEGDLIRFVRNFIFALGSRTPKYGDNPSGYAEETALLTEMTFSKNYRLKFDAIKGFGAFAPVGRVDFLRERASRKAEGCHNPNVVLVNCVAAVGAMAKRFPGAEDKASLADHEKLVLSLAFLTEVLDTEGRNNGACKTASDSILAVLLATGEPAALEAYIHNFRAPKVTDDWLRKYTEGYHERMLPWIREATGQKLDADFTAWMRWYREREAKLVYDPRRKRFREDAEAAKAWRKRLAALARK